MSDLEINWSPSRKKKGEKDDLHLLEYKNFKMFQ